MVRKSLPHHLKRRDYKIKRADKLFFGFYETSGPGVFLFKRRLLMAEIKVSVVMGSISDYETVIETVKILESFEVPYEKKVVSAHRTPEDMVEYAKAAAGRGIEVIIAAAGGAAHLPGMIASLTILPVIGIPIKTSSLDGLDSLLSINQMPAGVPVLTTAIGTAGAKNAALSAIRILAIQDPVLAKKLHDHQKDMAQSVRESTFQ
jgi:5-(carboxyamino)imidazole ribonucleotide mutase